MKYLGVESGVLEFKRELPQNDQIIKTMIGFSNQSGGKIVIGVANDRTIVGIPEKEANSALEYLSQAIYEASNPPILSNIYTQMVDGKTLLILEVSSGQAKPYYRKSEGLDKGTYIRVGRSTLRANIDMIDELKWQSRGKSFDILPVYQAGEDELDHQKIKHFIDQKKGQKGTTISSDLLQSYYLVTQEQNRIYATTAGILLFGKRVQYFFSEAMIICSHFKGMEGREVIASIDCTGTLFEQFESAFEFILGRLSKSFVIQKAVREEFLEIPHEAIREALLNLIVHRNYHLKSPAKIAIYRDRIEFFSPGVFPNPVIANHLQSGFSYIRNVAICKVFREAGYIEKMGSGLIAIFKSYQEKGLKSPSVIEGEGYVKCILPRLEEGIESLDEFQMILDLFDTVDGITISDVMHHLRLTRSTAGRKLSALVKTKKLKKVGKGRSVYYTYSSSNVPKRADSKPLG